MNFRIHDIADTAHSTCTWLDKHQSYLDWLSGRQRLLWIKGKPGAGKSTLMKYALDLAKVNESRFIAFFFHGRGTEMQKSLLGFFRSLLHQLLQQAANLLSSFASLYERKLKMEGEYEKRWKWQVGELRSHFKSYMIDATRLQPLQLYVDALDEAGEDVARNLIAYLHQIIMQSPKTNGLVICFACRHYPLLALPESLSICVEEENRDDIVAYVRNELDCRGGHQTGVKELMKQILEKATGIFQWVVLIIPMLLRLLDQGKSMKLVRRELQDIPAALNNLYAELLERIDLEDRSQTVKLMQWVCFAVRPLSLTELRYAMIVDQDMSSSTLKDCKDSEDYVETDENMAKRVVSLSGGLLEIRGLSNTSKSSIEDEGPLTPTAQFIHQSVQDYVIADGLGSLSHSLVTSVPGQAHFQLSRSCIRFMTLEDVLQEYAGPAIEVAIWPDCNLPFLKYCVENWMLHANNVEAQQISQADLLNLFAWPSSKILPKILLMYRKYSTSEISNHKIPPRGTTFIHLASRYDLPGFLRELLQSTTGAEANAKDANGRTPLSYAAEYGHAAVVELLLERDDIDVNSRHKARFTSIQYAMQINDNTAEVVRLLLERGDIDISSANLRDDMSTFLIKAIRPDNTGVVRMLLEHDKVDPNAKNLHGEIPLLVAVDYQNEKMIQLLLARLDTDVNCKTEKGNTPLMQAIYTKQNAIISLLLEHPDTDINLENERGWTALSSIFEYQSDGVWKDDAMEDLARRLLDRGAETERRTEAGNTPLLSAVNLGLLKSTKLLLERGANVNAKDKDGDTPLSATVVVESINFVAFSVQGDVNVSAEDTSREASVSLSVSKRRREIAELLLQWGVDIDSKDNKRFTPLCSAAELGEKDIVSLLLQQGADPNIKNQNGNTPLDGAAKKGNKEMLRLLLQN